MVRHVVSVVAIALTLACGADARAGDFSGTYEFTSPEGVLVLTLQQNEDGVEGTLNDGIAVVGLRGEVVASSVRGNTELPDGSVLGFVATRTGDGGIELQLFPYDETGNPILEIAQTLVFVSSGGVTSAPSSATVESAEPKGGREVYINRVKLDTDFILAMEAQYQVPIQDGRYWYDAACGAWGIEGGPTAGFLIPGLNLPGPMPVDISGGGTGVFINGREIHVLDKQALEKTFGYTIPGRWWLDAQGNFGAEGGPAIGNLAAAIQAAQQGSSVTHGYDSTYGARGTVAGGMYSGRTASGKSVFWYPGM